MKIFKVIFLSCFMSLTAQFYANAQTCTDLNQLSILIGFWEEKSEDGTVVEHWQKTSNKTFEGEGISYDISMNESGRESLRIVQMSGKIFYLAKVDQNQYPIPFQLTECSLNKFKFENPQHDFPNSITYEFQDKNHLRAIVRGDNDDGFDIYFKRVEE